MRILCLFSHSFLPFVTVLCDINNLTRYGRAGSGFLNVFSSCLPGPCLLGWMDGDSVLKIIYMFEVPNKWPQSQPANPMITAPPSHHLGYPMQHVGLDLFSFGGKSFLMCVDHWSGYPLYHVLVRSLSSVEVPNKWPLKLSPQKNQSRDFWTFWTVLCLCLSLI